jgi:putative tricarboxylic transport membrane protein
VLLGTTVGVLPGLGPVATIAMLLPITFGLPPVSSLIMLAGIYYGAQYGGSTTAILSNLPGESSSVVTAIDGYQMAKQGRAGPALATAALGSFFAGTVATVLLVLAAPPLADVALQFGPAEYFSLMVLGLVASVALASGSLLKAFTMIVLGLLLGLVGSDVETGSQRFTFDMPELADGLNFVALSMGVFGLGEILRNLEHEHTRSVMVKHVSGLMLSKSDFKRIIGPVLRGTSLHSVLGILPGGGAMLASFAAYTMEKRISKNRAEFGKGAIEGVAAPESANNAGAQTSFIPMLTLGIPSNPVMALMIAAMIIQGITPGPNVVTDEPELFWGMIVSMWVGNLMLVLLNLPLIGLWIRMLTIPYHLLFPAIIAFCCIGAFSVNNNVFDVFMMALFGLVGYALIKLDFEPAPLLLGFVLGPMLEENLRRAMLLSRGSPTVFVTHPLSLGLLLVAAALLVIVVMPTVRSKREEAFSE